jgi:monofunctional biosynthetic peptidoglycan transglycosylase
MGKKLAYWLFLRIPFWTIVTSLFLVTLLKWVPVRYTPLMLKRAFQFRSEENYPTEQKWVSLEDFSPELIQAVIACEDNLFFEHNGFDWKEVKKMLQEHDEKGRDIRGCSTITQQTAKNVFTLGTRTWVRKAAETYWTVLIEWIWGKRRILEVYLNVAETGRGIYGMEAASENYFGIPARRLDRNRAVALAICLPSPLESSPDRPTAYSRRRERQILSLIPKLRFPDWVTK